MTTPRPASTNASTDVTNVGFVDDGIVRAIPLPAVRDRESITVTYPAHPRSTALFDQLGGTLPVADEETAALDALYTRLTPDT